MRMLVVGAGGQVGGALCRLLGERAVGTWRQPPPGGLRLELTEVAADPEPIARALDHARADVLCIAAGFTHVDGCEREPATADLVNRHVPGVLASTARQSGARTVYLSTEYVFDGTAGPYDEDAPVNPISVYGRTKLQGERAVLEADPDGLVVRTTVVYGPEAQGKNFAYQVARRLRSGEGVRAPGDQVSSPTYNADLAAAIVGLAEAGIGGVVNAAGPEIIDRAEFARRLATAMGFDAGRVESVTTASLAQPAPRPLQAGLLVERLRGHLPQLRLRAADEAVSDWAGDASAPWVR